MSTYCGFYFFSSIALCKPCGASCPLDFIRSAIVERGFWLNANTILQSTWRICVTPHQYISPFFPLNIGVSCRNGVSPIELSQLFWLYCTVPVSLIAPGVQMDYVCASLLFVLHVRYIVLCVIRTSHCYARHVWMRRTGLVRNVSCTWSVGCKACSLVHMRSHPDRPEWLV